MQIPPDAIAALVNVTTNGTANTQSVATVVAAPGAGARYRVWGAIIGTLQNAAAQVVRAYLTVPTTSPRNAVVTWSGPGTGVIDLSGFGGIAWSTNTAISLETYDTLASQALACFVYYTLEQV